MKRKINKINVVAENNKIFQIIICLKVKKMVLIIFIHAHPI